MPSKTIFLVAGEASGDSRGAELISALKKINPELKFVCLGGPQMKAAGAELLCDLTSIAALGFGDVLRQYFKFRKIFYDSLSEVERIQPAAIILIDYPGFNIRFAKKIQKKFPVFYYVSPQIWAWAGHRIHTIKKVVSHMLVFFKFEEELYRNAGVPVTWVGHPLIEKFSKPNERAKLRKEFGVPENAPAIALLPGSRESEVRRILPALLESAFLIKQKIPNACFLLSETIHTDLYDTVFKHFGETKIDARRIPNRMYDILAASDSAVVTSGTATLETALAEVPLAIVYKTAWSTYEIGKRVIRLPYIGLPNVIAGKKIVQEFIQNDVRPEKIADEAVRLMNDTAYRNTILQELRSVKIALGPSGSSERAARTIIEKLNLL